MPTQAYVVAKPCTTFGGALGRHVTGADLPPGAVGPLLRDVSDTRPLPALSRIVVGIAPLRRVVYRSVASNDGEVRTIERPFFDPNTGALQVTGKPVLHDDHAFHLAEMQREAHRRMRELAVTASRLPGRPARKVLHLLLTGPPDFDHPDAWSYDDLVAWGNKTLVWLRASLPSFSVCASAAMHCAQRAPHIHFLIVASDQFNRAGWLRIRHSFLPRDKQHLRNLPGPALEREIQKAYRAAVGLPASPPPPPQKRPARRAVTLAVSLGRARAESARYAAENQVLRKKVRELSGGLREYRSKYEQLLERQRLVTAEKPPVAAPPRRHPPGTIPWKPEPDPPPPAPSVAQQDPARLPLRQRPTVAATTSAVPAPPRRQQVPPRQPPTAAQ